MEGMGLSTWSQAGGTPIVGRKVWCTHEHSRTLMRTPSATNLCKAGTWTCQAWSGWLRAPESSSNTHAESKELLLMGLELLRHSSVQQAQYRNENAAPREIQCAQKPTRTGHQLPISIQTQPRHLLGNQTFAI